LNYNKPTAKTPSSSTSAGQKQEELEKQMPLEGNLSAFGDQTNQFCSGHFGELKLQKKKVEKKRWPTK